MYPKNAAHQSHFVRGSIFLLVFASFLFLSCMSCASDSEKEAKHLERARQYVEKNELKKAVIEYKNVVQLNPKNDEAYVELGETHMKLEQASEAFQAFSSAVSTAPVVAFQA